MYTFDWLAKQAEMRPDKCALIDAATNRSFTYAEFNLRASRFAEFLRDEWRIQMGERVALLANNSSDYFEILWGCAKAGAILVCLNWRLASPELEEMLRDSTPVALIYDPAFAATAAPLKERMQFDRVMTLAQQAPEGEWAYETALAQASGKPVVMPATPLDTIWHILYTGGTTGRSKGVIQTHAMVLFNAINIGLKLNLTSEDVSLNLLPCFHTGGLNLLTNPSFYVGCTAIVQKAFDPAETLRLLSTQATAFFGVPSVYLFLSQHPEFAKTDLSRVRSWSAGGSPFPTAILQLYRDRGIDIRFGLGMTETGPTVFLMDEGAPANKLGAVGTPCLFVEVRVVDPQGNDVPRGERGEMLVKGPGVTPGYWRMPEVTAKTIVDGWLHSGDVAIHDEDGFYWIVDRVKDMYISGGENVYPAEVENVIYQLPQIAETAVIGVADEKWGEVGRALVALKPGQQLTEAEIIEHCRANLGRYKVPRSVVFLSALPRNPAGKVVKGDLRALYGE
jgi:fatty-acyl-CoA synthase